MSSELTDQSTLTIVELAERVGERGARRYAHRKYQESIARTIFTVLNKQLSSKDNKLIQSVFHNYFAETEYAVNNSKRCADENVFNKTIQQQFDVLNSLLKTNESVIGLDNEGKIPENIADKLAFYKQQLLETIT